jgi:hypothetical protein
MKLWSNKVSAYQRQELLHPFKLGAVLLLLRTQSEEGNLNNLHARSGTLLRNILNLSMNTFAGMILQRHSLKTLN